MTSFRGPGSRTLIAAFLLWSLGSKAWAQSSQATLQGEVRNQTTGQPIARALVLERNLQTNTQSYRYTNEQGSYYFPALLPGTYTVRVDVLGFQPEQRQAVELPVASHIELNFSLEPLPGGTPISAPPPQPRAGAGAPNILAIMYGADAAVPQALMITLPMSVTETLLGAISSLVDEHKIQELPLSGRDVYTLLVLQPGVTSDNATARGLGFSINGQRVASSNFLLDGVDNNDLLVTGPASLVSADAVKEYRMATNNYTAEFGRSSGFIANAITRTGTNAFHGTVFEFFSHDRLNANSFANNWQGLPKTPFRQNQYGASLGGPLRRDRFFFFGNFEGFESSGRSQPQRVFLPSPQFVSSLRDGTLAKRLLSQFPPPPGNPIPRDPFDVSYTFTLPFVQRNNFALGRMDYNSAGGQHHWSARYAFSQQTTEDFVFSVYPGLNAPLVIRGQNLATNYTRDLYGGANELKFGLNRNSVRAVRPHPKIPTLSSDDRIVLPGSEAAYDYSFRDTVFHVLDNFSRLSGNHALGAGFEWRPAAHDSLLSPGRDGLYFFRSTFNFERDDPYQLLISLNRQTRRPASDADYRRFYFLNEFAGFVQDNWKLTRRLTLNAGLRYEYFGAPAARRSTRDYNFVFGGGRNAGERIANGRLEAGRLFEPDRNDFAPRFGFALDVSGTGKQVIRGAYGIFFDRLFNNIWMDVRSNSLALKTFTNDAGAPPAFRYTFPASDGIQGPAALAPAVTVAIDQRLRTPYAQNWFFGFQRQLTPNFVLDVNHTGSLARKLPTSDVINRVLSLPLTQTFQGRFNPSEPDIDYRASQGHSDHLALQVALNRRWSRGVQLQVSYTYSRTRDVQSDPLGRRASEKAQRSARLADSSFFQFVSAFTRQFDPNSDYGHSDFDQTHNLVFNVISQVPAFYGWQRLFGSWQMAALAGVRSGFPFSAYTAEFTPVQSGGVFIFNRADFVGDHSEDAFLGKREPIPGGVILLDRTQFRTPAAGRMGDAPRNYFRGPGFWNVDLALSRSFSVPKFGEQAWLQFRVELFNVLNHANLNNPDSTLGSFSFGTALFGRQGFGSALPSVSPLNEQPRRIQLAVKVYF